jgi:hypothetical protein
MIERLARTLCRFQLAQSGQWGPRGLDKQVEKYWRDWRPEVEVMLQNMREPTAAMIAAEAELHDLNPDGLTAAQSWGVMVGTAIIEGGA